MARRRIGRTERVAIFQCNNGVCHLCGGLIQPGQEWDVSHDIPLELGGEDGGDNLKPAHRKCHRDHTAKVDAPTIAKVKRIEARHIGATKPQGRLKSAGFVKKERTPKLDFTQRRAMFT